MELASIVIWLLLTLAAFGLWLAQSLHIRPGRHSKRIRMLIGAVAVGCAVSFLFPVISLTDDFRCDQPSATRLPDQDISAHKWRPPRHQHPKWNLAPVTTFSGFSFRLVDAFQAIPGPREIRPRVLTSLEPSQGRSPPILSALS